ncbi:Hsp70 family protein [Gordonia sp. LSe1-13]|uniref:Hsp70 family protein n=1 Tax=Gordonia sesuvii TaxID=3116777 RepID=A0ABU7MA44_9ACTN|nr:Hsp70 family protein [Gordonia sp. LSe1-13]
MTFGIGVKIGADTCVATVASGDAWEATITRDTTELVGRDDFVDRVGDPVGLVAADGTAVPAADVFADAVAALTSLVAGEVGDVTAARLVIVHPDTWGGAALEEARAAVAARPALAGLQIGWHSSAVAAIAAVEHSAGAFPDGSVIVSHDLGASGSTVTVVRTGETPEVLGRPLASSAISGREFDRLLTAEVLDVTDAGRSAGVFTSDDPTLLDDLARLRAACREAKEALSVDTDAVVDVAVGSVRTDARLVRQDVENLFRPPILESAALIREALVAADVAPADVAAIVATGGGASIPLVAELLSTAGVHAPVVVDPDPVSASAAGAALVAIRTPVATDTGSAATEVIPTQTAPSPAEPPMREIIPPPALPVDDRPPRLNRRRRGTLVAVGTAALAVITATGLSVGTGLVGPAEPAPAAPAGAAVTEAPTTTADGTVTRPPGDEPGAQGAGDPATTRGAPGDTEAGPGEAEAPGPTTGTAGRGVGAPGTQAPRTPTPGTGTPGTAPPGTATPGTGSPGTGVPGGQTPGTSNPAPAPPPTTPPSPDTGGGSGGGGGNTGGGGRGGGLTQLPGEIVGGTGDAVCGVAGLLCRE